MKLKHLKVYFLTVIVLIGSYDAIAQAHDYKLVKDIKWASPEGFDLTMDIYTPETGKDSYPVLVIFHGGGWLINNKSIMNQMSQYVASHGEYVVCNVNYRLLGDQNNTVTMNEIVEDVFGAVLWVQENISKYKGNPDEVAVTGDSAGGHLAEMVVLSGDELSASGFDEKPIGFNPSYIPTGSTLGEIAGVGGIKVQAAVISYGGFDLYQEGNTRFEDESNIFWNMGGVKPRPLFGVGTSVKTHSEWYKAVSPLYLIPKSTDKKLPSQFFMVGSEDNLTTPELVGGFVEKLRSKGHDAEYWIYEGRPHAFLDSGENEYLGIKFENDAIEPLKKVIAFLDEVFY